VARLARRADMAAPARHGGRSVDLVALMLAAEDL
jgi:hypothetical protein